MSTTVCVWCVWGSIYFIRVAVISVYVREK